MSFSYTPVYSATSKLYIIADSDSVVNLTSLQIGYQLSADYSEVFKTWEVHEMVREALMVVGYNVGHKREIIELSDSIQRTGCPVIGVALNQVQVSSLANRKSYYGYGKCYSYYKHYSHEKASKDKASPARRKK